MRRFWPSLFVVLLPFVVVSTFADELKINDNSGDSDQQYPAIAMHANGPAVICWQDERNGNPDIYMQMINRRGMPFLNNLLVNDDPDTAHQYSPDVAMDAHGQFAVVWMDERNGPSEIFCQRFHANGAPDGESFIIPDDEHDYFNAAPAISMLSSGEFVVVWHHNYTDIFARRFAADGSALGGVITIHPPAEGAQISPDVAMHEDRSFMIVWEDRRAGPSRIWGRLFDADAAPITEAFELSTNAGAEETCHHATVAAGQNGEYVVAWGNLTAGTIFGSRFDSRGNRLGDVTTLSDRAVLYDARYPQIAAHPRWDLYQYAWSAKETAGWHIYTDVYTPGHPGVLNAKRVDAAAQDAFWCDIAMADLFNTVFVWQDKRSGDFDIYAEWQGEKLPMRTTAGSGFDRAVPISWEPPYGYTGLTAYHVHRIAPDGTHEVIASVDPSTRALPNLMLDYVDKDVLNNQTYLYGVQLDGERDDVIEFVEATPRASEEHRILSNWSKAVPTIDGHILQEEWFDAAIFENIANPSAEAPVIMFIKNDSSSLYIAIVDANDSVIDNGNQMGILFDENNDDQWEPSFALGEGMIRLSNAAQSFIPYVGSYPNDLTFLAPREATNVEFAMTGDEFGVRYEARISLIDSPLQATPGSTIGFGLWIEDPGYFCGHGNGNTGEWPLDALWDAAQTLGDLALADGPGTDKINLGNRYVQALDAYDFDNDGDDELVVLTNEDGMEQNGILTIFEWNEYRFGPIWSSDRLDGYPYAVKVVDLDADGLQDILVSCNGLHLYKRTGDSWAPSVRMIDWEITEPFVCADLNNDGLPDIAAGMPYLNGGLARIYRQNPDHTFTLVDSLAGESGNNMLCALDINNDNAVDLVAAELYSGQVFVYQNNGNFQFDQVFSDNIGERISNVVAADFDADGYGEFAITSLAHALLIYHNQRNGTFEVKYSGSDIGFCTGLLAVNLDKDAFPDIVGSPFNGNLFLYHNTGAFDFEEIDAELPKQDSYAAAYGDFDGNRIIDIAFGKDPVEVLFDAALRFGVSTRVVEENDIAPTEFQLHQNYPNPFNPLTTIEFDVARPAKVKLDIFDMLGRQVVTLVDEQYAPGHYATTFDAGRLASGLYFYRIHMGGFQQTRKMLLVR